MFPGRARCGGLPFIIAASLIIVACGDDPPDREIQQAQSTIDAARSAGASEYAQTDLAAAEQALATARTAVGQRDYRLALTNALESRERAQAATKEAADKKIVARRDSDRALKETAAALAKMRGRLKTAETARLSKRVLASLRRTVDDADRAVQEARAAFDASDYPAVRTALDAANGHLAEATRDLETPARPAVRPHR
jgi:Domain of unknown function (DUF4398)